MRAGVCLPLAALLAGAIAQAAGVEDIPRFRRVNDQVAIGGRPAPEQVPLLARAGYRAILDLREEARPETDPEACEAEDAELRYVRIPVSSTSPTDRSVEEFLDVTDDVSLFPLFIHCASGNRAAALWMVRRVLRDGWTREEAEAEATQIGLTSAVLREFARGYIERHLNPER